MIFSIECSCPPHQEEVWDSEKSFICINHTDETENLSEGLKIEKS